MNVLLIEIPAADSVADEILPPQTSIAGELPHVPGIDDLIGKEVVISELRRRIQELINAGAEATERTEVLQVIPYLLFTNITKDAPEHLTLMSPAIALMVVLDALAERFDESKYKVMLR